MNLENNNSLSHKTYGNQDALPCLPVPDLRETCEKFVEWVQPLLDEDEMQQTRMAVAEFLKAGGAGEKLQQNLTDRACQPECKNWLEPFWDDMYLNFRPSLNNMSFGYVFNDQDVPHEQLSAAARLIHGTLHFKMLLDREEVEADIVRGNPLCMVQFKNLFCKTRIPRPDRDELRTLHSEKNPVAGPVRHIIVACRGRFFSLKVLTESGEVMSLQAIERSLKKISGETVEAASDEMIGVLTGLPRDKWADVRSRMLHSNEKNFEIIESALFAVCLDDTEPETISDVSRVMLHGDGRNRWYDKNFQYIVCRNGKSGILAEHTGLDGSTILKMLRFVLSDCPGPDVPVSEAGGTEPEHICFHLDEESRREIVRAGQKFDEWAGDILCEALVFDCFGKNRLKHLKVSPDAFVQMAIQLAQYKLFGRCYSTYEAVMTRRFRHGRTEAMRSVSSESLKFVKTVTSDELSIQEKSDALLNASRKHNERIKECQAGKGVERHLFGLLKISQEKGLQPGIEGVPDIFNSPGWKKLRHDRLSTSNGSLDSVELFNFAPVVEDGFGIGYIIKSDKLTFNMTSFSVMKKELRQFVPLIEESLLGMAEILERS